METHFCNISTKRSFDMYPWVTISARVWCILWPWTSHTTSCERCQSWWWTEARLRTWNIWLRVTSWIEIVSLYVSLQYEQDDGLSHDFDNGFVRCPKSKTFQIKNINKLRHPLPFFQAYQRFFKKLTKWLLFFLMSLSSSIVKKKTNPTTSQRSLDLNWASAHQNLILKKTR